MNSWAKFQSSIPSLSSVPLPSVDVSSFQKNLKTLSQRAVEATGRVDPSEITELPAEYTALERRVDALQQVHKSLLKITKVHETETYDYPTNLGESAAEFGNSVSTGWNSFAEKNLKSVPLPLSTPQQAKGPIPPKTLPHAISRAARSGADELHATALSGGVGGASEKLGEALGVYAGAMEKVGDARLAQDNLIVDKFNTPWSATLTSSIGLALKARANVKTSRLELDAARAALKSASPAKQEQARLVVEESEDKLVQTTETAIGLMKAVLENPEPLANLSNLVKAQLIYFSTAAEALSAVQGDIDDAATAAETQYRTTRAG